jgi:hypothetical protein
MRRSGRVWGTRRITWQKTEGASWFVLLTEYYSGNGIMRDVMGEECSAYGQVKNVQCLGGKSDAGKSMQNIGVDGRSVIE